MAPVPYAQAAVVREEDNGRFVEVGYNEYGIIVANSATTMAGYKNFDRVREKVITDSEGMQWVSCDVYGYIDNDGAIHMKDRRDSKIVTENSITVLPFQIVDAIQEDADNVLSSVITTAEEEGKTRLIVNFELSPFANKKQDAIIADMDRMLQKRFSNIYDRIVYRKFDDDHPFPCASSGKRNVNAVSEMGLNDVNVVKDGTLQKR